MSSLEKCPCRSCAHVLIGLYVFLLLTCMNCLYILKINPFFSFICIIFSLFEDFIFILFIVPFAVQTFLSQIRSHLFIYLFIFFVCFHYSGRWITEELSLIYVIKCSAYVFL